MNEKLKELLKLALYLSPVLLLVLFSYININDQTPGISQKKLEYITCHNLKSPNTPFEYSHDSVFRVASYNEESEGYSIRLSFLSSLDSEAQDYLHEATCTFRENLANEHVKRKEAFEASCDPATTTSPGPKYTCEHTSSFDNIPLLTRASAGSTTLVNDYNISSLGEQDPSLTIPQRCFARVSAYDPNYQIGPDVELFQFEVQNGNVSGTQEYLPSEKDAFVSVFTGHAWSDDEATYLEVFGNSYQEGIQELSEAVIKITDTGILFGRGSTNVYQESPEIFHSVFTNKTAIDFVPFLLPEVDCEEYQKQTQEYSVITKFFRPEEVTIMERRMFIE